MYGYNDSKEYSFDLRWKHGKDIEVLNPKTNQWVELTGVKEEGEQISKGTLDKLENRIGCVVGFYLDTRTKEQREQEWSEVHKRMKSLPKSQEVDDNLYGYGDDNRYI